MFTTLAGAHPVQSGHRVYVCDVIKIVIVVLICTVVTEVAIVIVCARLLQTLRLSVIEKV